VHHVQGKAERVGGLLALLQEFYRDKLTELLRHEDHARRVSEYDINNAYQHIINREETELSWVRSAIADLGGQVDTSTAAEPAPPDGATPGGSEIEQDARHAQAFVDRWRGRVGAMGHARHRGMLRVILGETMEQKRFFDQALEGQLDLLGRRTAQVGPRVGRVLPSRWVE
jgi:hypothetical protein